MVDKPIYTELDYMTGGGRSTRTKAPVNWLLHTEEGDSTAVSLAKYCNGDHDVSYHYTLRDGIVCDVVDTDYASWSVLDANAYTINLCFAGSRSSWTRQQWMTREKDIVIAAYLAVQDCRNYKIPIVVIKPPYVKGSGISDHRYVTKALGIGTHTDVGDGFPWDVFTAHVNTFAGITNPVPPAPITLETLNRKLDLVLDQLGPGFDAWGPDGDLGRNAKGERRTLRAGLAALMRRDSVQNG